MDNITHTLTGLAISQAGFNRKTRFATLAILVGSNLPDVDSVSGFWGSVTYLQHHRGITHSIVGVAALGLALGGAFYVLGRKLRPRPQSIVVLRNGHGPMAKPKKLSDSAK